MNKVQREVTNLEKDICIICKYNMDQYPNYTKYFYKSIKLKHMRAKQVRDINKSFTEIKTQMTRKRC